MGMFSKKDKEDDASFHSGTTTPPSNNQRTFDTTEKGMEDDGPTHIYNFRVIAMVLIVSLGGLIFGFDTGQISGFLAMEDFLGRFSENGTEFTAVREGTITGLLSIGTLLGAIIAAPIADKFGRRMCILVGNILFWIGMIVQMTSTTAWYQVAIGRLIAGFGVGKLSVLTPMYMSETAPKQIRGSMVSCYQLFITLGILLADVINLGTKNIDGPASWRITMGIGFVWSGIMAGGIWLLPESPRWNYRRGKVDEARHTIANVYGVSQNHSSVNREIREIKAKFDVEQAGGNHPFWEVFTGPRMAYRVTLGAGLQMLQQLTGANFFFYYGTTIFDSVGISDSFVTATILGAVNFVCTFGGLWVVENVGRRKALIFGGFWMFAMFMVFASVGHFQLQQGVNTGTAGTVMIIFACLFIAGYATTWAPIVWCVVGELYPTRYRAKAMGIATASNWTWNFLIAFFTRFITNDIDYRYGYIFAACNFAGAFVAYFFLCEHQGRTLEEIDTMYILHVKPWKSSGWTAPENEELVTADALALTSGARGIKKADAAGMESERRVENMQVPAATETHGIHDVSGTDFVPESTRAADGRPPNVGQ
ncbi:general substrate transporter [Aureobasidium pullulans]|uniref:General substrate transporter n=2 Tax=Aureobasidium pullulans TaxID=5580 RepID=A0A4S9NRD8_AURPU|nr:general substrate transporter [Aureobasidium pullulans]THV93717.1 general substrate transporter [Aureobasidium pullulans]THW11826.1 general substrate transporter [Aureobasidium pullulans]THW20314.1 general substrate transporter [Aureobasidium pullulans]THW40247.1 general substrate transporter [Aureobasidium pullulans]